MNREIEGYKIRQENQTNWEGHYSYSEKEGRGSYENLWLKDIVPSKRLKVSCRRDEVIHRLWNVLKESYWCKKKLSLLYFTVYEIFDLNLEVLYYGVFENTEMKMSMLGGPS